MIAHTVYEGLDGKTECWDGLAIATLDGYEELDYNIKSFQLSVGSRSILISVDLWNDHFPLDVEFYTRGDKTYMVVTGRLAVFLQRRSLFITSAMRYELNKFGELPRGTRLYGECHRIITPEQDEFVLPPTLPQTVLLP